MDMKSLMIAAGLSLGLAGTACAQDETAPVEATPVSEEASGFNLKLPGEDTSQNGYGGFNLSIPSGDGPSVPVLGGDPLRDLPEIGTLPMEPATGDDDIVRLEPS